jgi:hypothetical protein
MELQKGYGRVLRRHVAEQEYGSYARGGMKLETGEEDRNDKWPVFYGRLEREEGTWEEKEDNHQY